MHNLRGANAEAVDALLNGHHHLRQIYDHVHGLLAEWLNTRPVTPL